MTAQEARQAVTDVAQDHVERRIEGAVRERKFFTLISQEDYILTASWLSENGFTAVPHAEGLTDHVKVSW
jgi:hypothetical protein